MQPRELAPRQPLPLLQDRPAWTQVLQAAAAAATQAEGLVQALRLQVSVVALASVVPWQQPSRRPVNSEPCSNG